MPRTSPYTIELSVEQRTLLEARARRYTLPYCDVIRAKIVLLAAAALGNDEIAAHLDTRREIVSKWRKRFFEEGMAGLEERARAGRPRLFPPEAAIDVKAMAWELPSRLGLPLSRLHVPDIRSEVIRQGIVAEISGATIWRCLSEDAIRPWAHRSWTFPRDPNFEAKAARVLDLYARVWEGKPLGRKDFVVSADEKTSIQARQRCHPTLSPGPGRPKRVEHEYERGGSLAYLAAWDCHRAKVFGRCEATTAIEPCTHLVDQVMSVELCTSARRVFWVVDNGSSHRGYLHRPTGKEVAQRPPRPRSRPCQLAQPSRDLLLRHPTQSPHPQRLRRPGRGRTPPPRLRASLRGSRQALRVEVQPPRP
ncbi:MAG: hypothetical protein QOD57_5779, partial [Actinomycetota bacterium]|nr:hypothetical protein [Actinomycetota bacterium]